MVHTSVLNLAPDYKYKKGRKKKTKNGNGRREEENEKMKGETEKYIKKDFFTSKHRHLDPLFITLSQYL